MKQILDIFSHKKAKAVKLKEKIIIDYREKNSLVVPELYSMNCETEFKNLKVADYLVGGVAIERKTVSDFISSMINRRLLRQLEELQQYENRLLIVEGVDEQDLYTDMEQEIHSGIHPNSVRGFLLSILIKHKVPIMFTKNYADTARFLSVLSKRKSKELPLNVSKKTLNKKEQLQFIVESFPGIGPKTSRKLLKHFKTIRGIVNSDPEQLKKIIGKKSESIIRIINQHY